MKNSILQPVEPKQCYNCGRQFGIEIHHIYAGIANRKISDANGFWIYLCSSCHRSNDGAQYNNDLGMRFKKECQEEFEKTHTREEFRKLIGKSYL